MTYNLSKFGQLLTGASIATAIFAGAVNADTIRFWTTEEQPARLAKQQAMAAGFGPIPAMWLR